MDIYVLRAIAGELSDELVGGRVRKIVQPGRRSLLLVLDCPGRKTRNLILSADPAYPRIHLTAKNIPSPAEPPDFCRSLRNHLIGAEITRISVGERERVVQITLEKPGAGKAGGWYALMAEIMGRWSNIVLVNARGGEIIDSIRQVSEAQSRKRPLLRGAKYQLPPEQKKTRPEEIGEREFLQKISADRPGVEDPGVDDPEENPAVLSRWLVRSFAGLSPVVAAEIAARAETLRSEEDRSRAVWTEFSGVIDELRKENFRPCVLLGPDGTPSGLSALESKSRPPAGYMKYVTMNEAADFFFDTVVSPAEFGGERERASREVARHAARAKKTLEAVERDLLGSRSAEEERLKGEILLENLTGVPEKASVFHAERGGGRIEIELDPRFSVSENAQRFFRRYKKLRRQSVVAEERRKGIEEKVRFLEGLLYELEEAESPGDLEAVRGALAQGGFMSREARSDDKKPSRRGRRQAADSGAARPWRRFDAPEGWQIFVGKSALGNDALMRRVGRAGDLWFHAQGVPGSHVILRTPVGAAEEAASEEAVLQAASLAAYHSNARRSGRVEVACVPFQRVRRPRGAPPGRVLISGQRTIAASPDEGSALMEALEEAE
jgi:predicted ribosome quality control (RQC) complex YloA/Tae2 family protein